MARHSHLFWGGNAGEPAVPCNVRMGERIGEVVQVAWPPPGFYKDGVSGAAVSDEREKAVGGVVLG